MDLLFSSGSMVYTGNDFSGIYGIQCHENSKWYVGESIRVPNRVQDYLKEKSTLKYQVSIYRAVKKHNIKNFSCYKLEECSIDDLYSKEVFWSNKLNSISPNGYNLKVGGNNKSIVSNETREKQSKSGKNKVFTEEHKKNISAAQKGMKNMLGKIHSEEAKLKMSKSHTGKKRKPMSEQTKKNISEARIKKYLAIKNNNNKQKESSCLIKLV